MAKIPKSTNTERFVNLAHDLRGFLASEDENPAGLLEEIAAALDNAQRQSEQLATARKALTTYGVHLPASTRANRDCLAPSGGPCNCGLNAALAAIDAAAPKESGG